MERKTFLAATAGAAAGVLGGYSLGRHAFPVERAEEHPAADFPRSSDIPVAMDEGSFRYYRQRYHSDLFDTFLPNMDRYVIDHELGGFMCDADIRTGARLTTRKRAWYEGRGIWLYSFLYHHLKQDPAWLEIARKSIDFILKHRPERGGFWNASFSREGVPLDAPGDLFGNLYVAEGLAAYARASGEEEFLELAKEIALDSLKIYDAPDYTYRSGYLPGARLLNHWMVFLYLSSSILEQGPDPRFEELAERCMEAILLHHLNPADGLLREERSHDLTPPDDPESDGASTLGLAIQSLWMAMAEARRREDRGLFDDAGRAFLRHVEVARDPVYGGVFGTLDHVESHRPGLSKALGVQEEVLIGTLLLVEEMGDPVAWNRFVQTHSYVEESFVRPGFKFRIPNGDRKVVKYNDRRVEHYHHPRHLMLNLLILQRMSQKYSIQTDRI